eukprot:6194566-Pleurochrysis_carterae.AAC.1
MAPAQNYYAMWGRKRERETRGYGRRLLGKKSVEKEEMPAAIRRLEQFTSCPEARTIYELSRGWNRM